MLRLRPLGKLAALKDSVPPMVSVPESARLTLAPSALCWSATGARLTGSVTLHNTISVPVKVASVADSSTKYGLSAAAPGATVPETRPAVLRLRPLGKPTALNVSARLWCPCRRATG